jgi:hypothetical protein
MLQKPSIGSWLSGVQGDREWGRGREHFSGFRGSGGVEPGPRDDPQEPATVRSCCGFWLAGRVGLRREMVGRAAHGANSEGWAAERHCEPMQAIADACSIFQVVQIQATGTWPRKARVIADQLAREVDR